MKNTELKINILNDRYSVWVMWGDEDYLKIQSFERGHDIGIPEIQDNSGMCYYAKDYHPLIILPKPPRTYQEIATLAHEAVHAVSDIYEKIGQNMNSDDEVFAHSVGAIVEGVLQFVRTNK